MEKPQETIEAQIGEVIEALVADVHYEKTWPEHTVYYKIDLNQFQEKLRDAITRAIEAHDKELAEKVENMNDVADIDTRGGAWLIEKDEVLALLTKQ